MSADDDEPQLRFVETTVGPTADVVETSRRHVDRRWFAAGALLATLALGVAIGFASGRHSAKGVPAVTVTRSAPTSSAPTPSPPSFISLEYPTVGARCSAQSGTRLQLGVEIVNPSDQPLTIDRVQPLLPLGGLRPKTVARGACGQLVPMGSADAVAGYEVAARASVWITIEADVLMSCPAALPVQMRLHFTQLGHQFTAELTPFTDLGDVHYRGCPTN